MEAVAVPDYSGMDFETLAGEIGLKLKHIPVLVAGYLEEAEQLMASLCEAIEAGNLEQIRHFAHSIKGSSGNLRLNELHEMARAMELAAGNADADFPFGDYCSAIEAGIATIPR